MSDTVPLFRQMLRIRMIEERIAERYPEQEMRCPVHLSIGQEAAAVAVCAALERSDIVMSGHRSHAHYLAKGGDLAAMLAEIYGKATGCAGGKGGSMHLVDLDAGFLGAAPIVASTIPIAVGLALGHRARGEERCVAVFFGDGASETGTFHESLDFAVIEKLPVLFVCENNLYSVYSPLRVRQPPGRRIHLLAAAHGIESHAGDGNDVIAAHDLARLAVATVRAGAGPVFLELATYRWREHCGPEYDNHIGYRSEAEFREWQGRCPLARWRAGHSLDETAMTAEIAAEIDAAFHFAAASPFPAAGAAFAHVHAG